NRIVVDDGGLVVNLRNLRGRQPMMGEIVVLEILERDEGKVVGPQAKIKIGFYANSVKSEPKPHVEVRMRRQRRPAAMIAGYAPRHPGWRPNCVRKPNPAATFVQIPAPVMKRRPTPGIIRLPEPARVRVNPMAAVAIRRPPAMNHDRARLPAPPVIRQANPAPVRSELIIEVIYLCGRRANVIRRGGC